MTKEIQIYNEYKTIKSKLENNAEIMVLAGELTGIPQKEVFISEITSKFEEKTKGDFVKNLPEIAREYYYMKHFDKKFLFDVMNQYFVVSSLAKNEATELYYLIKDYLKNPIRHYQATIRTELLRLRCVSSDMSDYHMNMLDYILREFSDFQGYIIKNGYVSTNDDIGIYYRLNYHLLYDFRDLVKDIPIIDNSTFKDITVLYNQRFKPSTDEKKIDAKLHKVTHGLSDRIIKMRSEGVSFGKIQRTLTKECIKKELIPEKMHRRSHGKGDANLVKEIDTSLPMSAIKKIVQQAENENIPLLN